MVVCDEKRGGISGKEGNGNRSAWEEGMKTEEGVAGQCESRSEREGTGGGGGVREERKTEEGVAGQCQSRSEREGTGGEKV